MDDPSIKQRIKRVLVESLVLDGLDPEEIEDEVSLRDELGLDSVDALELVLGLETEFSIKIQGKGLDQETFRTVSALAAFVEARLQEASGVEGGPTPAQS